jgi:hypothetical protein
MVPSAGMAPAGAVASKEFPGRYRAAHFRKFPAGTTRLTLGSRTIFIPRRLFVKYEENPS